METILFGFLIDAFQLKTNIEREQERFLAVEAELKKQSFIARTYAILDQQENFVKRSPCSSSTLFSTFLALSDWVLTDTPMLNKSPVSDIDLRAAFLSQMLSPRTTPPASSVPFEDVVTPSIVCFDKV